MFQGSRVRSAHSADKLTAICEPIAYTILNTLQPYRPPRHVTGIALSLYY
jgi:hypothetical protein